VFTKLDNNEVIRSEAMESLKLPSTSFRREFEKYQNENKTATIDETA